MKASLVVPAGPKPLPPGVSIAPTDLGHRPSLRAALEPFSETETLAFVHCNRLAGTPQWVATLGENVLGWCDIIRLSPHPGCEHDGRLGMEVVAVWRGLGLGGALAGSCLASGP